MEFLRQVEKFSVARRCLMLPHPDGIADSIADAFEACALGLRNLHRDSLDAHASAWLQRVEALMATSVVDTRDMDIKDLDTGSNSTTTPRQRWQTRAAELSQDEQADLSRLIDELAHWFAKRAQASK